MAKWKMGNAGLSASIQYESGQLTGESFWRLEQDEKPFIEQAKREREMKWNNNNSQMRKFATIPEIVAIEIKEKWGIDLHEPNFFKDVDKKAKFFQIVREEYPHLVVHKD